MILRWNDKSFWKAFHQLNSTKNWQSPLHTRNAQNYFREISASTGNTFRDQSFVLIWGNQAVFAFIGAIVQNDSESHLLAYEVPSISIEILEITKNVKKNILEEFKKILKEVNGTIKYRDYLNQGNLSIVTEYLMSSSAVATPIFSTVIDLNQEEIQLNNAIRKSYKSLINWGLRELKPKIYNAKNITWEKMSQFRSLHAREAGLETRTESSWRQQLELVKANEAFVICGHLEGELISAGFFLLSPTNCFYGSSASRRDMFKKPLFHSLLWTAILYAKNNGCLWFEVGQQLFPNNKNNSKPTSKELSISDFKAGFGGRKKVYLDLCLDK